MAIELVRPGRSIKFLRPKKVKISKYDFLSENSVTSGCVKLVSVSSGLIPFGSIRVSSWDFGFKVQNIWE